MRAELRMTLYTCMAVLTIAVQGYAQPQYTVTDLGTFQPSAIAGRWVVGSENGLPTRLNLDTMQKITLGHLGSGGVANAVIATGEAVGTIKNPQGLDSAAFWDAQGQYFGLPGPLPSYARDITAAWAVAGYSPSCPGGLRAMRWWPTEGRGECLAHLGAGDSAGFVIDGQDRIWGRIANLVAVWEVDQPGRHLGVAGEVNGRVHDAEGVIVVGGTGLVEGVGEPAAHCTWPPQVTRLPTLGGGYYSCVASGINRQKVTVGDCYHLASAHADAVIGPSVTEIRNLNDLIPPQAGGTLTAALGINDDGEIIGTSERGNWLLTPIAPSLAMRLNQTNVAPGQTLRMALDMHNPGPMLTTDVYVGIILPDGEQVVFLTNLSPLEGQLTTLSSNPRLFARLLQGVSWLANLHATQENYWVYARSGLEANGTYHLVIAWTKPNSLEDGRIDEGDILALDWKAFQFTGPASNLAAKARD
jgi:hypothetical protein